MLLPLFKSDDFIKRLIARHLARPVQILISDIKSVHMWKPIYENKECMQIVLQLGYISIIP